MKLWDETFKGFCGRFLELQSTKITNEFVSHISWTKNSLLIHIQSIPKSKCLDIKDMNFPKEIDLGSLFSTMKSFGRSASRAAIEGQTR